MSSSLWIDWQYNKSIFQSHERVAQYGNTREPTKVFLYYSNVLWLLLQSCKAVQTPSHRLLKLDSMSATDPSANLLLFLSSKSLTAYLILERRRRRPTLRKLSRAITTKEEENWLYILQMQKLQGRASPWNSHSTRRPFSLLRRWNSSSLKWAAGDLHSFAPSDLASRFRNFPLCRECS